MENNISSTARNKSKEIIDKNKAKSQPDVNKYGQCFSIAASTPLQHNILGYSIFTFTVT